MSSYPPIRIGSVPYLNADPLTFGLEAREEVILTHSPPSRLLAELKAGNLDCAFAPTFDVLQHPELCVVDGLCVSSDGPVTSVILISKRPLNELRSVGLDTSSSSSAHLIQILLGELFSCHPNYHRVPPTGESPLSEHDAVLLIGDAALETLDRGLSPGVMSWDLGALWKELTGLPFVFAIFVLAESADPGRIRDILQESKLIGLEHRDHLARRAASQLSLPESQLRDYLTDKIRYDLGPRELLGITRYRELLNRYHLLDPALASRELTFTRPTSPSR